MTDSNSLGNPVAVLALNPAVDVSYELPQLIADQKVQAHTTAFYPGGNGINVAIGLTKLGVPAHCCSVVGGESGDLLLRLLGSTLAGRHEVLRVPGETRVNATLLQKHPPSQFEVDSRGPEVSPDVLKRIDDCFLAACGSGIGVLTGSVPPGVPDDHYGYLIERMREQGGRAILDAHGLLLQQGIEARPYMVRVNQYVLEMATKQRLDDLEQMASAGRVLQRKGIEKVCISLGRRGAILLDADNCYHCSSPRVRVLSTVGCGDALLAGLIAADCRGADLQGSLRLGVICGSATATHSGTQMFTPEEVEQTTYELDLVELVGV